MPSEAPLGYRVLNAGRGVASAYAARLLSDLGASVSWLRWTDDRPGDWPHDDPLFRRWFERNVEVVDRPVPDATPLDVLGAVVARFDIVITDFAASEAQFGEGYERLAPHNPRVVVANADHFGRQGPYAGWVGDELTDYAMGGYWALAGDPGEEPLRVPGYQAQFHAGMQLAIAALAAARYARQTGRGQEVESTGLEAMLGAHWSTTVAWTHEGRILTRAGSDLFQAADGWVFFYRMGMYSNLFLLIEQPELMEDPRWSTITDWLANAPELWALVAEWCRGKNVSDIVETAQELRIPVTPMATAADLAADPVLAEREFFVEVDAQKLPGMPYLCGNRWGIAGEPSQLAEALAAPRRPVVAPSLPTTSETPVNGDGPLAGLTILELTNNWAGPIAGRHFGDLGAEVIKVELATKPATRASHYPGRDPGKDHWNRSGYFNEMNRNKRDVALNLATERGKELFLDLARRADVVIENNSARVMPNLGVGYERLREVNPRIIMASISGFGATGARRDWVAFGSNIEAACGLAAITGYPDGLPQRTGSFVADPIAGAHAVIGVLAALERRDRTGAGEHLDISLTESALPFMLEAFTHFHNHGELRPRMGNIDPWAAPVGAYRSHGNDNWIAVAVRSDDQWQALCTVTGIVAAHGSTAGERIANRAQVDAALTQWTAGRSQYEAVHALQSAGVPAAPILHNWQLHSDPHLHARDAFIPIDHPSTGVLPYPGFPWKFSRTAPSVRCAAPQFGEGNAYVFGSLLGLPEAEITALYEAGVTADEPAGLTAIVV